MIEIRKDLLARTGVRRSLGALPLLVALAACGDGTDSSETSEQGTPTMQNAEAPELAPAACDGSDLGFVLPSDLCATVFHSGAGRTRHLDVSSSGDVFVAVANSRGEGGTGGVLALRDTDGDGMADSEERFGDDGGNDVLLHDGYLYFAPDDRVLRYPMADGSLTPTGTAETIVSDLPSDRNHAAKSIAIGHDGALYVNIGSPSNACQQEPRTAGSMGFDPCPQLDDRAGVWRFDGSTTGQTQADGRRYSTGIRNAVALIVHPETGDLYGGSHGRDGLFEFWGDTYDRVAGAEKPSEEFIRITDGSDFGWPYCYHDPDRNEKLLAPEYGGDGETAGRCAEMAAPEVALPAHWAPNDLAFYTGSSLPSMYHGGAFLAFHGSWNRTPLQAGYNVVFLPFEGGQATGEWWVFADGFKGGDVESSRDAVHRPTGLAVGPDGALYISSDTGGGTIWKVIPRS